ncbi:MAG: trehalase family glycosidase [Planctomycetota bacterium]
MPPHKPTGWNTWDYRGFNRLVYLDRGRTVIAVKFAVWDETAKPSGLREREAGKLHDSFRWQHAARIGPHAPLGLPAQVEFTVGAASFVAEAVSDGKRLALAVRPSSDTHLRIVFMFVTPEEQPLARKAADRGVFAGWNVELEGAVWPREYFLNMPVPYCVAEAGQAATVHVFPRGSQRFGITDRFERYRETTLEGGGELAGAPEAMTQAVNWNTLHDSRLRLTLSPVCRDWCIDWRGPIVFGWDSFFTTAMAAAESRELARMNFESGLAAVDELGFVPNYYMSHGAISLDRSMPPLGAYVIWKLEQANPDLDWLGRMYPKLRRWHRFWMKNRKSKYDLLSWGSNPEPHYEFPQLLPYNPSLQHTAKCAMYEAGLDNSPMYDDVAFNEESHVLELADVALNSYYAMDCESLAAIAEALGKPKHAAAYRREYEAIKRRMNQTLWDADSEIYANRHWDGRFSRRWSPSSFFPLAAGIADHDQAGALVERHLLNEAEFWGEFVIPSIARNDPAYPDNDYWRGRIWGPFNFLVAEGLRRYRFDEVAVELARRGLQMFLRNWRDDGGVYENYNAETGKGADVWNAARLYHWGGLLALVAIQELIDSEPAGYLRFGSIEMPAAEVRNFRLAGSVYGVALGRGVAVRRDGEPLLECDTRAIVRVPLDERGQIELTAPQAGKLVVHGPLPLERDARLNGRSTLKPQRQERSAVYCWE